MSATAFALTLEQQFELDALRQGDSDGRFGYPRNPGNFAGRARSNYLAAFDAARLEKLRAQ